MADLTHVQNPTIDAIYRAYEERERTQTRRPYLGGSALGTECRRQLWYGFRWVSRPNFPGRVLRLFETGHREEERIIGNLRAVGVNVLEVDPDTGQQWEIVDCDGHLRGHADGALVGLLEAPETWHLFEAKTHNAKSFADLKRNGVQKSKPVHYAQMQLYMGGLGLKRAVYVAQCKNTDELYLERIKYSAKEYKALLAKASAIIKADSPPPRPYKDQSFYLCRFCDYSDFCWVGKQWPDVNCRTCAHSSPVADAQWACARGLEMAPRCPEHIFNPTMVEHWAKPLDGAEDWVLYDVDGYRFVNCAATAFPALDVDHYSSEALKNG